MITKRNILRKSMVYCLIFVILFITSCGKKHNEDICTECTAEQTAESGEDTLPESVKSSEQEDKNEENNELPDVMIEDSNNGAGSSGTQSSTKAQSESVNEKKDGVSGFIQNTDKTDADNETKAGSSIGAADIKETEKDQQEETAVQDAPEQNDGIMLPDDVF